MATDEFGERTEQATDHRRQEERRRGNVARSAELSTASHLLTTAALLYAFGGGLVEAVARMTASHLRTAHLHQPSQEGFIKQAEDILAWAGASVLPWLAGLLIAAIAVGLVQTGFLLAPEKLTPRFDVLNPVTGLKRIFSVQSVVTLAISLCKLGLLFGIAGWFVWSELPQLVTLSTAPVGTSFLVMGEGVVRLAMILAAVLITIGLGDYGFQWWKHERDIRMTKEELRREIKEMDGDPLIRRRRRAAHQKLAESRDINKVLNATFLLGNPTHVSVAFRYDPPQYPAPTVICKGLDEVALRMRELAEENSIPVLIRPELARQVYRTMKVGETIPADLYDVFIEIMKHVYAITGQKIDLSRTGL